MGTKDLETETQKKIGALLSEMKEDADKKDAAKQAEKTKANADAAANNAEVAKAAVEAKKLDAQDAQTKAAAQEVMNLADFLI